MHVVWLAEGYTWGPLTRVVAVLGAARLPGHVLAQRSTDDNAPLIVEKIPFAHAECCGERTMGHLLDESLAADVIVADMCWADLAKNDGRPSVILGMHGDGDWDLDDMPIHPWAWQPFARRKDIRLFYDVDDDTPLVAVMSPVRMENVLENHVRDALPAGARLVSLTGVDASRRMVGADLVVTSAGWGSSWEARWTGAPYCLVDVGGPDQPQRATHSYDEAREAVANVRLADLPPEHTATRVDHVTDFTDLLHLLVGD
jgi:hypothetical protein